MIISILQESLVRALNAVAKAVESKPALPVLANVLLVAENSRLMIAATNLQMSITVWTGAKIEKPGAITLPARTFTELVNKLSKDRVDLTLDEETHTVRVQCGSTTAKVKGISADEFPPILHNEDSGILVSSKMLKDMIGETVFSVAHSDARPILTGLCLQLRKGQEEITLAAADGYRLAVRKGTMETPSPVDLEVIIPAKVMGEVARMLTDDAQEIGISLPGKRDVVTFHLENIDVTTQLLEGRYPDFMAIVPRSHVTSATIYAEELLRKCQTAMIFAKDNANSGRLRINPNAGEIIITGSSAERGISDNTVSAEVVGDGLDTSFNVRYLIDMLSVLKGERVVLETNGAEYPGVVRPENRNDFIHVIMPMGK